MLIDEDIGKLAAQMRARYNLSLTDALQIATAIQSGCDAFLTNDLQLKRVNELSILVVTELILWFSSSFFYFFPIPYKR